VTDASDAVAGIKRAEWGRIVSSLIRVTGDWALAEDSAQDAFESALTHWSRDGVPPNPAAWVTMTARNRAIDRLRRSASEASKLRDIAIMNELNQTPDADDRLELIFTCCHPALPLAARVALTLRTVAGLTTPGIASAFLMQEATMAQRLARATRKIANAGIPYRVPPPELLGERLEGVLAVLYLLFNEGYSTGTRADLADTAIALGDALVELMPGEPAPRALLALMLLQHSRRDARYDSQGVPLTLEDQNRELWDRTMIERGLRVLSTTTVAGRHADQREATQQYAIQAEIAACHARAATAEETDWQRIADLYSSLFALTQSPVVAMNRAIAVGMNQGPDAGLALLADLAQSPELGRYHLLPAARADLLRRAGRFDEAVGYYERAIELAPSDGDRVFLERRLAEVRA
jgi:RNA polymerase sigma-70 factor (ECF subfamily)